MTTEETAALAIKLADQGNDVWRRFIADAVAKSPKKRTVLEKAVIRLCVNAAHN